MARSTRPGERMVFRHGERCYPCSLYPELDPENLVLEYGEFYSGLKSWRRVKPPQPMFLDEEPEINREV